MNDLQATVGLWAAVASNDPLAIKNLVRKGGNLSVKSSGMLKGSRYGNAAVSEDLLDQAIEHVAPAALTCLLELGCRIRADRPQQVSPWHAALKDGKLELVQAFMAHKPRFSAAGPLNAWGDTPLVVVLEGRHAEICALLATRPGKWNEAALGNLVGALVRAAAPVEAYQDWHDRLKLKALQPWQNPAAMVSIWQALAYCDEQSGQTSTRFHPAPIWTDPKIGNAVQKETNYATSFNQWLHFLAQQEAMWVDPPSLADNSATDTFRDRVNQLRSAYRQVQVSVIRPQLPSSTGLSRRRLRA